MENNRKGCTEGLLCVMNRDLNAVRNMQLIVNDWLSNGSRPLRFTRGFKIDGNPNEDE